MAKIKITVAFMTPSYFQALPVGSLRFLRVLITRGEAADVQASAAFSMNNLCFNGYGPTECTVFSTMYQVQPDDRLKDRIPLGKPVSNYHIYILNEDLQPIPVGAEGEICISGAGLSRGYLNRPELTAEKFVDNPFQSELDRSLGLNGRLYRTGDLGRWLADGNLEYIGRNDFQVKIRGYRIELGEIEAALRGYAGVRQWSTLFFINLQRRYYSRPDAMGN